jgi:hypothetical protein
MKQLQARLAPALMLIKKFRGDTGMHKIRDKLSSFKRRQTNDRFNLSDISIFTANR